MKNNKNAKKEITRDVFIKIPLSQEEKNLWLAHAESLGINSTRYARNTLMIEAEKSIIEKGFQKAVIKSYLKYCELTNNQEVLDRIKRED